MSGTFSMFPRTLVSVNPGTLTVPSALSAPADIINAMNYAVITGGGVDTIIYLPTINGPNLSFECSLDEFYLDGSLTPTPLALLPVGFIATSMLLQAAGGTVGAATGNLYWDGSLVATDTDGVAPYEVHPVFDLTTYFPLPVPLDLSLAHVKFELIDASVSPECQMGGDWNGLPFGITGTYSTLSFTWTLENPSVPVKASSVSPSITGDTVTITSVGAGLGGMDLSHVNTPSISYTDLLGNTQTIAATTILAQTEFLLEFIVPPVINLIPKSEVPIGIIVVGDGTQFSGSITLGSLQLYIADASGIYKLVSGQTYDVQYTGDEDTIQSVKIPNPFIKTAFLP